MWAVITFYEFPDSSTTRAPQALLASTVIILQLVRRSVSGRTDTGDFETDVEASSSIRKQAQ